MNPTIAFPWMIALPLVAAPIIYLVGRLSVRSRAESAAPARWMAIVVLLVTAVLAFFSAQPILQGKTLTLTFYAISLRLDGIALLLGATVTFLGLMVAIFSLRYMHGDEGEEKYYALLVAMVGSIIGLGCAADLFNLWVWFEVMAISSFMLVAFYRDQPASLEAGLKYLVQSAAGSVLILLGIALVFASTGMLDLAAIRTVVNGPAPILIAAGALFIIGFGVKAAFVPLHTWLPDAHSQAPSGISAMLSGIVIEAGLVAMLRALGALAAVSSLWGVLLLIFGAFNMLVGNLMALRQEQVKRLLAYSSVSHLGYMLVGLGASITFPLMVGTNGAEGAFFHLFNHATMKGLAFLSVGALLYALHIARGDHGPLVLSDLDGASRRYPAVAFSLAVAVLALGGLPPLSGFMSKWMIFVAGFQSQNGWMIALVIFMALNSVLSLGYYAPLVNRMFRHTPAPIVESGAPVSFSMRVPLALLTLLTVVLGFWPTLLSWLTAPAASALMVWFGVQ